MMIIIGCNLQFEKKKSGVNSMTVWLGQNQEGTQHKKGRLKKEREAVKLT